MGNIDYFIGVDVSKNSLSVCILFGNTKNYFEIANEKSEILKFFAMYGNLKSYAAFENTNTYNYDLMRAFDELGLPYARLDAFKFFHFLRHNSRLKTDKMDSYAIALYAKKFHDELETGKFDEEMVLIKSYQSALTLINKINNQLSNFNDALQNVGNESVERSFKRLINNLEIEKKALEDEIYEYIKKLIPETEMILAENKGLSKMFAIYVLPLIYINRARKANQITCYMGLVPFAKESGISLKGGAHISGGARLARRALFMSSLSICRYHPFFSEKYNALVKRGKAKNVAHLAICRKIVIYIKRKYFN